MQNEWISVEDRYPDNGKSVLVSRYNKNLRFSSICIDNYLGYNKWSNEDFNEDVWEITHWMPLPETPNITRNNEHIHTLEIPDEDIVYTKDKWLVLNMESEHLGKAIKQIIDYSCGKRSVLNDPTNH